MAYPEKPLTDYERSHENGGDIKPPPMPTPEALKVPRIQGGAPKLTETTNSDISVTPARSPGFVSPTPGDTPYWERLPPPNAPTRHTLYPASPWKREDVDKQWGGIIKPLGDRLWDTYQKLPPEQKALPAWQQVAKNPQEAAQSIMTRALINQAGVRSELKPETASSIQTGSLFRWLNVLGGK